MYFFPTIINIGDLKINSADHTSPVSLGSNFIVGNHVGGRKNQGFGQQCADFSITAIPIHVVLDDDLVDSPSFKNNK
jgi:hypothetical protein